MDRPAGRRDDRAGLVRERGHERCRDTGCGFGAVVGPIAVLGLTVRWWAVRLRLRIWRRRREQRRHVGRCRQGRRHRRSVELRVHPIDDRRRARGRAGAREHRAFDAAHVHGCRRGHRCDARGRFVDEGDDRPARRELSVRVPVPWIIGHEGHLGRRLTAAVTDPGSGTRGRRTSLERSRANGFLRSWPPMSRSPTRGR